MDRRPASPRESAGRGRELRRPSRRARFWGQPARLPGSARVEPRRGEPLVRRELSSFCGRWGSCHARLRPRRPRPRPRLFLADEVRGRARTARETRSGDRTVADGRRRAHLDEILVAAIASRDAPCWCAVAGWPRTSRHPVPASGTDRELDAARGRVRPRIAHDRSTGALAND